MSSSSSKRHKRPESAASAAEVEIELVELQHHAAASVQLSQPFNSKGGAYNMDNADERHQLAHDIWTQPFTTSVARLREDNPALVDVLHAQISNKTTVTEAFVANKEMLVDGMLLDVCRAQSQKRMPLATAALGILSEANLVRTEYHNVLSRYHKGFAPSVKWVHDFMKLARTCRPPPPEATLPGVAVATFDNLSMNVDYKSYVTEGEGGYKLDMTNWFSTYIPQHLAPQFNPWSTCEPDQGWTHTFPTAALTSVFA